jgi:hypothetical protein
VLHGQRHPLSQCWGTEANVLPSPLARGEGSLEEGDTLGQSVSLSVLQG